MPSLGVNIAIICSDQILLTKREDVEVWCLPGGGVDAGESVAQAAVREAREETGLKVQLTRLVGIYSRPRWRDGGDHVALFAAQPVGGMLWPADGEALEVRYFALHELPEMLIWWHRQRILDALSGIGGAVAWSQDAVWPFKPDVTRQQLYALRDRSGLSKQGFYSKYFGQPGPGAERLEVAGKLNE
jgi:ADP-ribose pyrophosphatase YjhB (NUDIX family)